MQDYYDTKNILSIDQIKVPEYAFILIASKRKSGKSILTVNLIKNILNNNEIDHIILFSKTAQYNNDYDFIDKKIYK